MTNAFIDLLESDVKLREREREDTNRDNGIGEKHCMITFSEVAATLKFEKKKRAGYLTFSRWTASKLKIRDAHRYVVLSLIVKNVASYVAGCGVSIRTSTGDSRGKSHGRQPRPDSFASG